MPHFDASNKGVRVRAMVVVVRARGKRAAADCRHSSAIETQYVQWSGKRIYTSLVHGLRTSSPSTTQYRYLVVVHGTSCQRDELDLIESGCQPHHRPLSSVSTTTSSTSSCKVARLSCRFLHRYSTNFCNGGRTVPSEIGAFRRRRPSRSSLNGTLVACKSTYDTQTSRRFGNVAT